MGYLFGGIALLLWMGYQVMELKSIMNYLQLLFLPSGADPASAGNSRNACWPKENAKAEGKHYTYNREEGSGHLVSLNLPGKIVVVFVTIARLFICYKLTIYGAQFLCYTSSLKDFLLNSVALVFVYDIDELFFTVFLSSRKQRRIATLEPPRVYGLAREVHHFMGGTVGEFVGLALTVFAMWWFGQAYLAPFANAYYEAYYGMCGEVLGMAGAAATSFSDYTCHDQDFDQAAVLRGPGGGRPLPNGLM